MWHLHARALALVVAVLGVGAQTWTDTDCHEGVIGGIVTLDAVANATVYTVYYAQGSTIVDQAGENSTNSVEIANTTIPDTADTLAVYANGEEVGTIPLADVFVGAPQLTQTAFVDEDTRRTKVAGSLLVTGVDTDDSTGLLGFEAYWADANGIHLQLAVSSTDTALNVTLAIPDDSGFPAAASQVLVYSLGDTYSDCTSLATAVTFSDDQSAPPQDGPKNVSFVDQSCVTHHATGVLNFSCAAIEYDFDHYDVSLRVADGSRADHSIASADLCNGEAFALFALDTSLLVNSVVFDTVVVRSFSASSGFGPGAEALTNDEQTPVTPSGLLVLNDTSCVEGELTAQFTASVAAMCTASSDVCGETVSLALYNTSTLSPALVTWDVNSTDVALNGMYLEHSIEDLGFGAYTQAVLYATRGNCNSDDFLAIDIEDAHPPTNTTVQAFVDTNQYRGYASGELVWAASPDATAYQVLVGQNGHTALEAVTTQANLTYSFVDFELPALRTLADDQAWLVVPERTTRGGQVCAREEANFTRINDANQAVPRFAPSSLTWGGDTNCDPNVASSTVVVGRAQEEVDVDSYQFPFIVGYGLEGEAVPEVDLRIPDVPVPTVTYVTHAVVDLAWQPVAQTAVLLQAQVTNRSSFEAFLDGTNVGGDLFVDVPNPERASAVRVAGLSKDQTFMARLVVTNPRITVPGGAVALNTSATDVVTVPPSPTMGWYRINSTTMFFAFQYDFPTDLSLEVATESTFVNSTLTACSSSECSLSALDPATSYALRLVAANNTVAGPTVTLATLAGTVECGVNATVNGTAVFNALTNGLTVNVTAESFGVSGVVDQAACADVVAVKVVATPSDCDMCDTVFSDLDCDVVVDVGAGRRHTCLVLSNGNARCFGSVVGGVLGVEVADENTTHVTLPHSAVLSNEYTAVRAAAHHSCALTANHQVYCWGEGGEGQLGYNSTDSVVEPSEAVVVGVAGVVDVALGNFHTCAITELGTVRCWGLGLQGQLGYGKTTNVGDGTGPTIDQAHNVPFGPSPTATAPATAIAAGAYHTCVLADGQVFCFGLGEHGQLGLASTLNVGDNEFPAVPVDTGGKRVTQIAAGGNHTCAVLVNGTLMCWGQGTHGQLGYGSTANLGDNETPASVGTVQVTTANPTSGVTSVCCGGRHTCVVVDGAVRCFGDASSGQLGYGSTNNIGDDEVPSAVPPVALSPSTNVQAVRVYCGYTHTCALLTTGMVECWGSNADFQLGLETNTTIGDDEQPMDVAEDVAIPNRSCNDDAVVVGVTTDTVYSLTFQTTNRNGTTTTTAASLSSFVTPSILPLTSLPVPTLLGSTDQALSLTWPAVGHNALSVVVEAMKVGDNGDVGAWRHMHADAFVVSDAMTVANASTADGVVWWGLESGGTYVFRLNASNLVSQALSNFTRPYTVPQANATTTTLHTAVVDLALTTNHLFAVVSSNDANGQLLKSRNASLDDAQFVGSVVEGARVCVDGSEVVVVVEPLVSADYHFYLATVDDLGRLSLSPRYPVGFLEVANTTLYGFDSINASHIRFELGSVDAVGAWLSSAAVLSQPYVVIDAVNGTCGTVAPTVVALSQDGTVPTSLVSNLRITDYNANSLDIAWDRLDSVREYVVEVALASNNHTFEVREGAWRDNVITVDGLTSWLAYTVRVRASNFGCANTQGQSVTGVATPLPSFVPTIVSTTHYTRSIFVEWTAVVNATKYRLDLRNASSSEYTTLVDAHTLTNYTIENLQYAELYYFRIVAGNIGGFAEDLAEVSFLATQPRHAVMELYHATGGTGWTSARSWGDESTVHLCNWDKVSCSAEGNLTRLLLGDNNLVGSLPDSLDNLGTHLTHFVISENSVDGTLPTTIGLLSGLKRLLVGDNALQDEMPDDVTNLVSLTHLAVGGNEFIGTIPAGLSQLSQLVQLDLSRNNFVGQGISLLDFSQWAATMQLLDVSSNQLTGTVPTELGLLTAMYALDLSNNNFYGSVPAELSVIDFTSFACNYNFLDEIACTDCPMLDACACSSCFPRKDSTQRDALSAFYAATSEGTGWVLGASQWENMPNPLCNVTAPIHGIVCNDGVITSVVLPSNNLQGMLPAVVGDLTTVEVIVLNNNALYGSIPTEWSQLASLATLQLSNNALTGSLPTDFRFLYSIVTLHVEDNALSGTLPPRMGSANLRFILLNNNHITGTIPSQFGSRLNRLVEFEVENNALSGTVPEQIGHITTLRTLHLANNTLTGCLPTMESASTGVLVSITCKENYIYQDVDESLVDAVSAESCFPTKSVCGDGVKTPYEECDDDNNFDGAQDGCNYNCVVHTGWQCDDEVRLYPELEWDDLRELGVTEGCSFASYSRGLSNCYEVCGNGIKTVGEECDDGNSETVVGGFDDGCTATCDVMYGWSCTNETEATSVCDEVCGNGIRTFGPLEGVSDGCDAGGLNSAEYGCVDCLVEPGFDCVELANGTSVCREPCGNSQLTRSEECDDGNEDDFDGCSSSCQIEPGWYCTQEALQQSECWTECGDGITVTDNNEQCDSGSGCSSSCRIISGWYCSINDDLVSSCHFECPDNIVTSEEECDDNNHNILDGCNNCTVMDGWQWDVARHRTFTVCGDGVVVRYEKRDSGVVRFGGEECDPPDPTNGCTTACLVKEGWECLLRVGNSSVACSNDTLLAYQGVLDGAGIPSEQLELYEFCGNGITTRSEECDDRASGDTTPETVVASLQQRFTYVGVMDGCHECVVDLGWQCQSQLVNGEVRSVCEEVCGNGYTTTSEECDDGNVEDGDGCDSSCVAESGYFCVADLVFDRTNTVPRGTSTCTPLTEIRTLFDYVFLSMGGAEWTNSENWAVDVEGTNLLAIIHQCYWYGIECDGSQVVSIRLPNNNLRGTLNEEVAHLDQLQILSLPDNQITGTVPDTFTLLTNLQYFDLRGNQLTSLKPLLFSLPAIRGINVANNRLGDSFGSTWLQSSTLRSLSLDNNALQGSVSWELASLPQLTSLSLTRNQLSGSLPVAALSMPSVTLLRLTDNELTGTISGSAFCSMPSLSQLDLGSNAIHGSLPPTIACLTSLVYFDASGNALSGSLPSQLAAWRRAVRILLHNNALTGSVPSQLGRLTALTRLQLQNNQLAGTLPSQLGVLSALSVLNLEYNLLEGTVPQQWSSLDVDLSCGNTNVYDPLPCCAWCSSTNNAFQVAVEACQYCAPFAACPLSCNGRGVCVALAASSSPSLSVTPSASETPSTAADTQSSSSSLSPSLSPSPSPAVANTGVMLEYKCVCEVGFSSSSNCASCSSGFAGTRCRECPGGHATPCHNHGSCLASGTGAVCACDVGFLGDDCASTPTPTPTPTPSDAAAMSSWLVWAMLVLVGVWRVV